MADALAPAMGDPAAEYLSQYGAGDDDATDDPASEYLATYGKKKPPVMAPRDATARAKPVPVVPQVPPHIAKRFPQFGMPLAPGATMAVDDPTENAAMAFVRGTTPAPIEYPASDSMKPVTPAPVAARGRTVYTDPSEQFGMSLQEQMNSRGLVRRALSLPGWMAETEAGAIRHAPEILGGFARDIGDALTGHPAALMQPGVEASRTLDQAVYDFKNRDYGDVARGAASLAGQVALNTLPVLDEIGPGVTMAARDLRAGAKAVGRGLDEALTIGDNIQFAPSGTRTGGRELVDDALGGEGGYLGRGTRYLDPNRHSRTMPELALPGRTDAGPLAPQQGPLRSAAQLEQEAVTEPEAERTAPVNPLAPARGDFRAGNRTGAVGDLESANLPVTSPLKKEVSGPAIEHAGSAYEVFNTKTGETVSHAPTREAAASAVEDHPERDYDLARPNASQSAFASTLYSRLGKAINEAPFEKGTAEQWKAALAKNVPASERAHTGIDALLAENAGKPLTKTQVADAFNAGRVQLGEVTLGGEPSGTSTDLGAIVSELGHPPADDSQEAFLALPREVREAAANEAQRRVDTRVNAPPTRYPGYVEPGGTNYREHLITLEPQRAPVDPNAGENFATWVSRERPDWTAGQVTDAFRAREGNSAYRAWQRSTGPDAARARLEQTYTSSHWPGVDNPLVHVRTTDRVLPSGEKALFLEELQSDWHQQGRRNGYQSDLAPSRARLSEVQDQIKALEERGMAGEDVPQTEKARWADLKNEETDLRRKVYATAVPDAPLKKTPEWAELGLKKAVDTAVREGHDRIAWTTGEQQAARYDLSKQMDELHYEPKSNRLVALQDGNTVHSGTYDPKALPDVIGKDVADKLLAQPLTDQADGQVIGSGTAIHSLTGEELKLPHKGMRDFYDKILPNVVKDYAKKMGVKINVEAMDVMGGNKDRLAKFDSDIDNIDARIEVAPDDSPRQDALIAQRETLKDEREKVEGEAPQQNLSFKITPELKAAVLKKGQPLGFAHPAIIRSMVGTAVGGAAGSLVGATPEERKRNAILGAGIGMAAAAGIPAAAKRIGSATEQAFKDVYAPIREDAPELHATLHAAGAMPPISAGRFVSGLVDRSLEGLTAAQRETLGKRIQLANFEALAETKQAAADDASARLGAEPAPEPTKSARNLWYSRTTKGGALRAPEEMETEPLIQELSRRADAQQVYHKDVRRFGPTSAVTQRNEIAIYNIEKILTERDGLDGDEVWNEIARRKAESRPDAATSEQAATDFNFGANVDQALDFEKHPPVPPASETGIRAKLLQDAADRFSAHAERLRGEVSADVHTEPWFQKASDALRMNVEGFNEAGAVGSGVSADALRRPEYAPGVPAPYMRLISQDRLNEQMIRQTQEAAARTEGATTPRTGWKKTALGERPDVQRLSPVGAARPLEGPADVRREKPAMRNFPPGTAATGSKKQATGTARQYVSDVKTAAVSDAKDKVSKMQRNAVYEAIAKIPDAELAPDMNAPPGKRVLTFNDLNQLVPPPPKGSEIPVGFRRFAVPAPVAEAVDQFQRQAKGQTGVGHDFRRVAGFITRSVLLNPAAAAGHAMTLASSIGAGLPADAGAARALASGLPMAKMLSSLKRFKDVDFSDPQTVERLHRLALSGALRIAPDESAGWINKGHHILFGPSGIDPRARVVASEDFEAGANKAGLTTKDPGYTALERDYVTGHTGNYVGRNAGSATQWLQDAGITPFIAINTAKYKTAFGAMAGKSGVPGMSAGDRALTMARGPLGTAGALAGAGYLLSGHSSSDNAVGHEGDLATGVYHLPNGEFHYFRGSPDEAAKQFGADAKEVYLRKGLMDQTSAAALRLLEPIAYAAPGDKVSEVVRAAANAALGLVGPAPAALAGLATGKSLYIDPTGALGSLQGVHLQQDVGLVDRVLAAARNVNTGAALAMPSPTPNGRSATSSLLGNLNPFTEGKAGSVPRLGIERRKVAAWQSAVVKQIYSERDPAARQQIMDAALEEAQASGYTGPSLRSTFEKAVNRAASPRSGAADIKFQNRIKGAQDPAAEYLKQYGRPK